MKRLDYAIARPQPRLRSVSLWHADGGFECARQAGERGTFGPFDRGGPST